MDRVAQDHQNVTPVILDVTKPDSIAAAKLVILEAVGDDGIQALINNAGKGSLTPVEYIPADTLLDELQVNLIGAVQTTQAFLPLLRRNPDATGRIVNIGSMAGV